MVKKLYYWCLKCWRSHTIKNKNVTIISNNCWGGFMYQSCKLEYQSPFVGLFILARCYIELLERFDEVINRPLIFKRTVDSKYKKFLKGNWIIGMFEGTDIEIVFMHYHSESEIRLKWNRRLKRIDRNNMLVKLSDTDEGLFNEEILKRFEALPFKHKVCFTCKPYPQSKSVIYLPEFKNQGRVLYEWAYSNRHYKFVKEVNKLLREG